MDICDTQEDKCYSICHGMTWADVKRAMTRVKKFRKQGFYLIIEQEPGAIYSEERSYLKPSKIWKVAKPPTFTGKLMGPVKLTS